MDLMKSNVHNLIYVLPERIVLELEKVYKECPYPSEFFFGLFYIGGLSTHFDILLDLAIIPAGPYKYHGHKTAFVHSMDAFDYAKRKGYSFDVALAALFHDVGKGKTPIEMLPHHYGHEERSVEILTKYLAENKFERHQNNLILAFAKYHMKFHSLKEMRPVKVIRFYREIKNKFDEMIMAAECDNRLDAKDYLILAGAVKAVKDTVIEIPADCKDKKAFVEEKYINAYKEIMA